MIIEQNDIDIVTFLCGDKGNRVYSQKGIEEMLHQATIFHYLAVLQLLGRDIPQLDEIAEMISKLQDNK
jgi:hypothetical protein